jgi:hypothetical protein
MEDTMLILLGDLVLLMRAYTKNLWYNMLQCLNERGASE